MVFVLCGAKIYMSMIITVALCTPKMKESSELQIKKK